MDCPRCGCETAIVLTTMRKSIEKCRECDWTGEPFYPEPKEIQLTKTVPLPNGCHYEIFDKRGVVIAVSGSFSNAEQAESALRNELEQFAKLIGDESYGLCTGVIWPATTTANVHKVLRSDELKPPATCNSSALRSFLEKVCREEIKKLTQQQSAEHAKAVLDNFVTQFLATDAARQLLSPDIEQQDKKEGAE